MDRYDPHTDKFLRDTQYGILGTDVPDTNVEELIYRQAAIDALRDYLIDKRCPDDGTLTCRLIENKVINKLPSAQPEIIRCKDCKYWNSGTCECREHVVNCQDYMVGDIETDAEYFCEYAEKREE